MYKYRYLFSSGRVVTLDEELTPKELATYESMYGKLENMTKIRK